MILMPFWQSSEAPLLKALTTPSVKSRLLILTWTCPMSISIPRTKPLFNLSIPRVLMSFLVMMPLPTTLMVTEEMLLRVKRNQMMIRPVLKI